MDRFDHSTVQTEPLQLLLELLELVVDQPLEDELVLEEELELEDELDPPLYGVVRERNFVAKSFTSFSPKSPVILSISTVSEKSSLHLYT